MRIGASCYQRASDDDAVQSSWIHRRYVHVIAIGCDLYRSVCIGTQHFSFLLEEGRFDVEVWEFVAVVWTDREDGVAWVDVGDIGL